MTALKNIETYYYKIAFILAFMTNNSFLFGQNLDSCGLSNNPFLTESEATFLNNYLTDVKGNYDFHGKKVAIIGGPGGSRIEDKKEYFDDIKVYRKTGKRKIATWHIILTEEERVKSGGYDVLLTHWVKLIQSKKQIIKKLSKQKMQ